MLRSLLVESSDEDVEEGRMVSAGLPSYGDWSGVATKYLEPHAIFCGVKALLDFYVEYVLAAEEEFRKRSRDCHKEMYVLCISYCIMPYIRGGSRDEEVLEEEVIDTETLLVCAQMSVSIVKRNVCIYHF